MNAVEIEEAITLLSEQPFEAESFPYAFLEAFGNKETTIKRLKSDEKGSTNASDLKDEGGVLQKNNIHMLVCPEGQTADALSRLRESLSTAKAKAKFILTTDGKYFEAEDLLSGESVACNYVDFPNHFGFFLPLAGISTVKQIRDSSFDIRATSRLNRLYVELLSKNPDWDTAERRHDMNHFMARLIFCFFAEDTDIFNGNDLFTDTISQMSESNSSNTHEIISEMFRAMNTKLEDRKKENIRSWADKFPYVNGGLFSGSAETPIFSKIARSYLLHVGSLDWTQINPDIFGSMIQAVADDDERGSLGMHYTSVPNILKVLNPLFLDNLREQLEQAGGNGRKLLNLRKRIANIRVFDPACGSGNFLVIAYKQMREIEAEINKRRNEPDRHTEIPLTNYRGIEYKDFPAEIARLALIIAEYQCDLQYRGQRLALAEFLPLSAENWITCGNALRLDWLSICPPTGTSVKVVGDDLFETPLDQAEIDFENEGGETYICGNPPYQGSVNQTSEQKEDMAFIFKSYINAYKDLDYVASWFVRASEYMQKSDASAAFVSTNSICQGEQVAMLWPIIFSRESEIKFAHKSFLWKNNAANNAGVTCIIIGVDSKKSDSKKAIYEGDVKREVTNISPYLIAGDNVIVKKRTNAISELPLMTSGNKATDGGNLILSQDEKDALIAEYPDSEKYIKFLIGAKEFIRSGMRWCLWISDEEAQEAQKNSTIAERVSAVKKVRLDSRGKQANENSNTPYKFVFSPHEDCMSILIPSVSSERREYLPCGYFSSDTVIVAPNLAMYDAPLWNLALIASKLHITWIATVCGKLKTDFRYSNTLGWNTFPVPKLTEKNKKDLTRCAEGILLAREAHFPATIADLYDPDKMPEDLRLAHERNDEVLERIYIGRRFKNDTERLEKLFDLYTQMTTSSSSKNNKKVS